MSTSLDSPASSSISRQEYLSSLPRWRQFLAKLNWHPVVDYEIREIDRKHRLKQLQSETEQLKKESAQIEKETEQLKKESAQIEKETEQLKKENARMAELDARLDALWRSYDSNLTPAPPTPSEPST